MIISHFARLNSIFWIKNWVSCSEWMTEEKKERERDCRWKEIAQIKHFQTLGLVVLSTISLIFRKFNYTEDNTCLNLCLCISGGPRLPQHPAHRHQTELCPEWQTERWFHTNDQRAWWLCAPTTEGFTVPMMRGERELSGRAAEKKGGRGRKGLCKMKAREEKKERGELKGELLSMAERRKESRNEKWETDGEKRHWGRSRWRRGSRGKHH